LKVIDFTRICEATSASTICAPWSTQVRGTS